MSSISENKQTKQDKIIEMFQHIESIQLSLTDLVEFKNKQTSKPKKIQFNMNKSWADSDDEDEMYIPSKVVNEIIYVVKQNHSEKIQNFINEIIDSDNEMIQSLMNVWNNLKIEKDTETVEEKKEEVVKAKAKLSGPKQIGKIELDKPKKEPVAKEKPVEKPEEKVVEEAPKKVEKKEAPAAAE